MKYIDRKGNITIEENGQDKFLRHLYNDWGGRLCLKIIIQPFVTRLGGWFLNTRLSARMISGFVERNHIDLSSCTRQEFASYNDFFTRRLKEGQRPVAADDSVVVSPCDGKVTVSRIGSDSRFYIKDTLYTLERLLRNKKLAERYLGGYAVILRLTVDDYHHYCYVADGEKSPDVKIPGVFHTVNPAANDVCQIYHENTREYCLLKTEQFGTIAMMEVGAMMVGKITNLKPGPCEVKKGEEKGYFEFGGSTIVLLLQHGKVRLDSDLIENSENGYSEMEFLHPVDLVEGEYRPEDFYAMAKGMEDVPEGGERCFKCYRLRMEAAAKLAQEGGYDYFTTTLSISPLKNAGKINEIGQELAQIYKVEHLPSDFKKKNGYKRSIELSHEYGLYRQNYCGCVFSKRESMEREKQKQQSCMDCQ